MAIAFRRYSGEHREVWDDFVRSSKNGTFLFLRDYMDYHRDRFVDHSLMAVVDDRLLALLPANQVGEELHSHGGLTYGGFVTSEAMTAPLMIEIVEALVAELSRTGIRALLYKTIPSIYHALPADEDLYALFRADASLYRRDVLSVVRMAQRPKLQDRRRRGATKATRAGVAIAPSQDWPAYWAMLSDHLAQRFETKPVHALAEIEALSRAFPDNIKLHAAFAGEEMIAGVVLYLSTQVTHVQYIASSAKGRDMHALDLLFASLLDGVAQQRRYFDFGISNEQQGRFLNRGLIEQKEGFGGRAVAHDFYRLDIPASAP